MDVDDVRESDVRVSVSNRAGDSTRLDVRCQVCRERGSAGLRYELCRRNVLSREGCRRVNHAFEHDFWF